MKNIKAILFDLDGTLLPMELDDFSKAYFSEIAKFMQDYGYESKMLIHAMMSAIAEMVKNDGKDTNEVVFWKKFAEFYGERVFNDKGRFDEFYYKKFDNVKSSCSYSEYAAKIIRSAKEKGYRLILATSPLFPAVATEKRMVWAGLSPEDFEFYTTYENSRHSKPSIEYYKDILSYLSLSAEECLMVGNHVEEDMVAEELGMNVYLVTDCLINKNEVDISRYEQGSLSDLFEKIQNSEI